MGSVFAGNSVSYSASRERMLGRVFRVEKTRAFAADTQHPALPM